MSKTGAGKIFNTIIVAAFVIGLVILSFWWSLGQTISFTKFVFFGEPILGTIMGILIQMGPQVFLFLAQASTDKNERLGWMVGFYLFSAFDAATNVGARVNRVNAGAQTTPIALYLGYGLDIAVVFAEEMIAHSLGVLFYHVAEVMKIYGAKPPAWFQDGIAMSKTLSGSTAMDRAKGKSNSNKGTAGDTRAPQQVRGGARGVGYSIPQDFPGFPQDSERNRE